MAESSARPRVDLYSDTQTRPSPAMGRAIAAAGVYALEHNVERLAEGHANAKRLAEGLADIAGISIAPEEVETNMVYFAVDPACKSAPGTRRAAAGGAPGPGGPRRPENLADSHPSGCGRFRDRGRDSGGSGGSGEIGWAAEVFE